MATLYHLKAGKSKKRLKIVMTDQLHKVENYRDAVQASHCSTSFRHFAIEPAEEGAKVFNKRTTNKWTNYNKPGPQIIR